MDTIKVLVVDDSAMVRQLLTEILSQDPQIEVVGTAPDPYIARDKIKRLNPDVLTLDVEMPRMDGVTFLANLMRLRPMPVVMVSSLTEKGADVTLRALELGAVDFVTKPAVDVAHGLEAYAQTLIDKVKAAARVRVRAIGERPQVKRLASTGLFKSTDKVIAVGASTGGTEAIKDLLLALPADTPGMVVTQHIPAAFSAPFARRMDGVAAMTVREASDGEPILPRHARRRRLHHRPGRKDLGGLGDARRGGGPRRGGRGPPPGRDPHPPLAAPARRGLRSRRPPRCR